jgi:hypothetical protein
MLQSNAWPHIPSRPRAYSGVRITAVRCMLSKRCYRQIVGDVHALYGTRENTNHDSCIRCEPCLVLLLIVTAKAKVIQF